MPNMENLETPKEDKKKEDGEESDQNEEEEVTAAKLLNEKIVKAAGIGELAGDIVAQFSELRLIIPRGKYNLELYPTFMKLHGRTYDYKILYKDVLKGFLLPKPDGVNMVYLLYLKTPLRQG